MNPQLKKSLLTAWTIFRRFCQFMWEVICWLIIPTVFGLLCYASLMRDLKVTVLHISLAAIAVSPWILRLLSRYLEEFNFGLKGVSGKTRAAVRNKDEIDGLPATRTANSKESLVEPTGFTALLPESKKVLRTLWKYQVELFGADDMRRWGFVVSNKTTDYQEYQVGVHELLRMGLVAIDSIGLIFLTLSGINFGKQYNKEIVAYPYHYSNFVALTN